MEGRVVEARALLAGSAAGQLLVLGAPLSFWGGVDVSTGEIIDRRHPQFRANLSGKVLVMPHGKGSSSASSVLAECLRLGTGPVAMVLDHSDEILLVGALVAQELYATTCPIVVVDSLRGFESGRDATVDSDTVVVTG